MLDDLGTSLQASDFADSSDVLSIPLDAKFEVFVRVEPLWIHAKLSHCLFSLGFDLAGHLLEFDNYKLSRFQWREANHDVDDAKVDIVLRCRLLIAFHEIRVFRRGALKGSLPKEVMHERADVEANLGPERLVIGLEYNPLRAAIETLFDVKRGPPHRYILPFGSQPIIALQRARAPNNASSRNHRAQAIDAQPVEFTILGIG